MGRHSLPSLSERLKALGDDLSGQGDNVEFMVDALRNANAVTQHSSVNYAKAWSHVFGALAQTELEAMLLPGFSHATMFLKSELLPLVAQEINRQQTLRAIERERASYYTPLRDLNVWHIKGSIGRGVRWLLILAHMEPKLEPEDLLLLFKGYVAIQLAQHKGYYTPSHLRGLIALFEKTLDRYNESRTKWPNSKQSVSVRRIATPSPTPST